MTTTIELPDPLLQRARLAAVERHTTLDDLVLQALEKELLTAPAGFGRRMTAPPIAGGGPVIPARSNAELASLLEEEENTKG